MMAVDGVLRARILDDIHAIEFDLAELKRPEAGTAYTVGLDRVLQTTTRGGQKDFADAVRAFRRALAYYVSGDDPDERPTP